MAKTNLRSMSVEQLLQLRDDVGKELNRKTVVLRSQLARLGAEIASSRGRGGSVLRGKKVPPKYEEAEQLGGSRRRDPDGLSRRLKKEGSWKTLPLKKPLPEGSEEKNEIRLLVAPRAPDPDPEAPCGSWRLVTARPEAPEAPLKLPEARSSLKVTLRSGPRVIDLWCAF